MIYRKLSKLYQLMTWHLSLFSRWFVIFSKTITLNPKQGRTTPSNSLLSSANKNCGIDFACFHGGILCLSYDLVSRVKQKEILVQFQSLIKAPSTKQDTEVGVFLPSYFIGKSRVIIEWDKAKALVFF